MHICRLSLKIIQKLKHKSWLTKMQFVLDEARDWDNHTSSINLNYLQVHCEFLTKIKFLWIERRLEEMNLIKDICFILQIYHNIWIIYSNFAYIKYNAYKNCNFLIFIYNLINKPKFFLTLPYTIFFLNI